jgi:hypothetical protein
MAEVNPKEVAAVAAAAPAAGMDLSEFYRATLPDNGPYALFSVPRKKHIWKRDQGELVKATNDVANEAGWYFATASFDAHSRTQDHVQAKKCLYLDIDAGAEKFERDPDGTYPSNEDAQRELMAFIKATKLLPSIIVHSGAGLHVYYALAEEIGADEWLPLAQALGATAKAHGLKVDSSCTTDSARVLRPPGALHKNGQRARVLKATGREYTPAELDRLLPAPEGDGGSMQSSRRAPLLDVNAGLVLFEPVPTSALKVAENCAAMREIAEAQGHVPEPRWRAMLGVVKACTEGLDIAHEWSRGHPDYDPEETEEKYNRYAAGPTTCEHFARLTDACSTCPHKGKIKSPIVLGRLNVEQVQALPVEQKPAIPPEVAALNERFALVRIGADVVICDLRTPTASADGIRYGIGWMSVAAFRQMHAGALVVDGSKTAPLADYWLRSPHRRQYEAGVYAPGEQVPDKILNLDQGFAVEPAAGDVGPWLQLLGGQVLDPKVRSRFLKLMAWKIQNPGGVPGVIPILTGGKGTGKNSLLEPIVRLFGPHGAVFDDAEQVAGRFTGHLMATALAVLDEALFAGDPRQMDRIKARVTATTTTYEFKGRDPVRGVNRCMFVLLTNHAHVWQATLDERRPLVIEVAGTFVGDRRFWSEYHGWLNGGGPAALLHYLLTVDLNGFDPRTIPQTDALRRQVEMTALRSPAAAWWHGVLCEGALSWRDGSARGREVLKDDGSSTIDKSALRLSFTGGDPRRDADWSAASRQLRGWVGLGGLREVRRGEGASRIRMIELPSLPELRAAFTAATGIATYDGGQ